MTSKINNSECIYCVCKNCDINKECVTYDIIYCNNCNKMNMKCQNPKFKSQYIKDIIDKNK